MTEFPRGHTVVSGTARIWTLIPSTLKSMAFPTSQACFISLSSFHSKNALWEGWSL